MIKRQKETVFNLSNCNICQKSGCLVSTTNGRKNVLKKAAENSERSGFMFKCYKNYTYKNSLDKMFLFTIICLNTMVFYLGILNRTNESTRIQKVESLFQEKRDVQPESNRTNNKIIEGTPKRTRY